MITDWSEARGTTPVLDNWHYYGLLVRDFGPVQYVEGVSYDAIISLTLVADSGDETLTLVADSAAITLTMSADSDDITMDLTSGLEEA